MGASESKSKHDANMHVVKKGKTIPHFITIKGLELDVVKVLLGSAAEMKSLVARCGGDDRLKHRILASVFYEPSTRTSCSFSAAMLRLGGQVVTVNDQQSSVAKGESLDDTIQTMACYCDATVLRHPEKGSAAQAAGVSTKPIINAGDGTGEHPTQAMLDLFTIESELGTLLSASAAAPLTVVLLGDLKHGRTVHSLVRLLALFAAGVKLVYVSPPTLCMPQELCEELAALHVQQSTASSLAEAIVDADVLYVTRIQKVDATHMYICMYVTHTHTRMHIHAYSH